MSAVNVWIGNLLRLDEGVQFLLAIFQAHGQIGRPSGMPKEIEVIAEALALIEPGHGAEETVLPLKSDRHVLKRQRFLSRR